MKNIITKSIKLLIVLCGVVLTLPSCSYKKIMDADYPAQLIYMPAAVSIFVIDNIPQPTLADPTPGNPYNIVVDLPNKKLNIPLGIYRSGIDNKGAFTVDIAVNNDTINKLLAISGKLPSGTILLNADKYTVPSSVMMKDGQEVATFNLAVNLDSLSRNAPNRIYALAVGISSTERASNPKLNTTILVINNKMMVPTANFTSAVDAANAKNIIFNNTSLNTVSYSWDFGDGSTVSTDHMPSHTYPANGTYVVTLTAKGITGEVSTKVMNLTIAEKIDKSTWTITGFDSQEPAEGNATYPNNGLAKSAIDSNLSTFWHTQWSGGSPAYPHWFSVDMGKTVTITNFEVFRRQGNSGGQDKHQFFVSTDGVNWTDVGTFDFNRNVDTGQNFVPTVFVPTRYFKYVALHGPNFYAFISEINASGF